MEILQVVGISLMAAVLLVVLRQQRPEIAVQLSIAVGVIIFLVIVGKVRVVIQLLEDLAFQANVNVYYITTVMKIIGIAYITEFASQICKDAGEGALGAKVELAGKVTIMVLAVPIVLAVLELVVDLLS